MLAYAHAVLEATSHAKDTIKHNKRWSHPRPTDTTKWTHILDKPTKEKITRFYEAIPRQEQLTMRASSVLNVKDVVKEIVETSSTTQPRRSK
jgi:alkyl hydroperoxide reductase subunit AhpC